MRAPHISLENAEAVNEHFSQVKPNPALMRTLHFVMGQAIKATTKYKDNSHQLIQDALAENRQLFLAHNHQSNYDPFVLASMLQREKVLRPMRTRTVIPGKSPLFNHPLYGWVVRNSGAVPIFRKAEFNDGSEQADEARRKANELQITIMRSHMNRGLHAAIYPEGTRGANEEGRDPTQLMPLHAGIGRIACSLNWPENVRIVCIGTIYTDGHQDKRHPVSVVTEPFKVAKSVDEVVSQTQENLQEAVRVASYGARALG